MAELTVSVVVPVFNCERYLADALESIFDQGHDALDVVVVDDGSTDGSAAIASSYPVRLLEVEHGGIARARNAGIAAARGELLTFLDADDVWTPGSLRKRIDLLLGPPELDAVFGLMRVSVEPGLRRPSWFPRAWEAEPQNGLLSGMLAWRRVFDRVGPFDPAFEIGEDTDWFARFKDAHMSFARVPEVVMLYRRHEANTTNRREVVGPNLVRIMKATLDRQRAASRSGARP